MERLQKSPNKKGSKWKKILPTIILATTLSSSCSNSNSTQENEAPKIEQVEKTKKVEKTDFSKDSHEGESGYIKKTIKFEDGYSREGFCDGEYEDIKLRDVIGTGGTFKNKNGKPLIGKDISISIDDIEIKGTFENGKLNGHVSYAYENSRGTCCGCEIKFDGDMINGIINNGTHTHLRYGDCPTHTITTIYKDGKQISRDGALEERGD